MENISRTKVFRKIFNEELFHSTMNPVTQISKNANIYQSVMLQISFLDEVYQKIKIILITQLSLGIIYIKDLNKAIHYLHFSANPIFSLI